MKKQHIFTIFLGLLFLFLIAVGCSDAAPVTKIEWNAVTLNTDGTPCDDLAGYKVYCTKTPPTYTNGQSVGNVLIVNLADITAMSTDGLYTCVVTAFDVWDNESAFSNSVTTRRVGSTFFGPDTLKPGAASGTRLR